MDINELLSNETKKMIAADLQKEVDRQIQDYPIRVNINGVSVDWDGADVEGGEIEVNITLTDKQFLKGSDRYQLLVNLDELYPGEIGEYVKEQYGG